MFYISGTVNEDRTLKTDKNMQKFIMVDSSYLEKVFELIKKMNEDFNKV